jgi:beta-N-acetylhexosaminidase
MVARVARHLLIGLGAVSALSACATSSRGAKAGAAATTDAHAAGWADSVLATLSLRDKAAQMVWPWVLGDYTATDDPTYERVLGLVRDQHVGGVIISVGSPTEIASKLNALQRASALPLLVGADLETGAAFRARGGYFLPNAIDLGGATWFPYQMGIGATRDTTFAYEMGRVTAREGRALGIHVAFAPVLDVNNNPKNPVISLRSFGENPQLVAQLGAAFVHGIQDNGMLATGKHFPGHGDTEQNSHLELARVNASAARQRGARPLPRRRSRGRARDHDLPRLVARPGYLLAPGNAQPAHHDRSVARKDWLSRPHFHRRTGHERRARKDDDGGGDAARRPGRK